MRGHIKEFGIRKGKTHLFPVNSKPHNIWGISAGSICVPTKPSPSLPIGSPCSADNNRDERNKFRSLDSARFDSEAERSLQTIYHLELWRNFGSARNHWPRRLIRLDWSCISSPGTSIQQQQHGLSVPSKLGSTYKMQTRILTLRFTKAP